MFKRFADLRVVDAPPAAEVSTSAFDVIAADSRSADVQRRRAAAMSLGERGDLRASAYLQSWFPAEREHLTRAFVLIALGRCSDAEARVFLHRAWRSSSTSLRPWCAIALAIRARMQGDEEIRAELRRAAVRERNQIAARATLLACGIAGDEAARPMALLALRTGKNTGIRVAAARTLAMLGGEQACTALTQAIAAETCPTTRAILADALGELGRVEDAPLLIQYLLRYSELAQRRTIARAIARLGPAALEKLMQELARDHIPAAGRASLIDALGWFLAGDQQPPALAILLQSANYMTTPTWMESALTRIE